MAAARQSLPHGRCLSHHDRRPHRDHQPVRQERSRPGCPRAGHPDLDALPEPGVTTAQFFTNALNTRTHGLDVVAAYATRLASGTLSLTASASFTKTQVERVNVPEAMADTFSSANLDTVRARILNREDRNRLEDALPRAESSIAARYTL